MFSGQRVRLRAIEPGDLDAFVAGDDDTDNARASWRVFPPRSHAASAAWITQASEAANDGDVFRLAIEAKGEVVGTLNTFECDPIDGTFSYGVSLFAWAHRQGYGQEAIVLLLRYMFGERRYQRCWVRVYSFNDASVAFHQALGFQVEGRLRRAHFTAGEWHDEIVLGILSEEFAERWGMDRMDGLRPMEGLGRMDGLRPMEG